MSMVSVVSYKTIKARVIYKDKTKPIMFVRNNPNITIGRRVESDDTMIMYQDIMVSKHLIPDAEDLLIVLYWDYEVEMFKIFTTKMDGTTDEFELTEKEARLMMSSHVIVHGVNGTLFRRIEDEEFINYIPSTIDYLVDPLSNYVTILGSKREYFHKTIVEDKNIPGSMRKYVILGREKPEFIVDPKVFDIDGYFIYGSIVSSTPIGNIGADGSYQVNYEGDTCVDIDIDNIIADINKEG